MRFRRLSKPLGSLPDSLIRERRDLPNPDLYAPAEPSRAAPDVRYAPGNDGGMLGIDLPKIPTDVTSTFDTRPINGTDAWISDRQSVTGTAYGTPVMTLFSYIVPKGYVFVVREFVIEAMTGAQFGTQVSGLPNWGPASLRFNGISQLGFSEVNIPTVPTQYKLHAIADEGMIVTVTWAIVAGIANTVSVLGLLYGNLLLKRGYPLPYEIGSGI